ncbi:META domain-containing protein [Psychrobacter glaciei]|uniref:META domain-containing protein n=1 Tax=Psychrobacter glaciei TaxID=619771 RepID=UPI001F055065|nr:META domain-containing protein [Psychrobacter glaciei]MCH1781626.1 META domain-containing protein [Psychrobacter glaciei]
MFLLNKARPLILTSLFAAFGVVGCQSTATTSTLQTDKDEDINHLISAGSAKPLASPTGLPINSELLERFDWQLVSAISNTYDEKGKLTRKPLGNFYHPDHPISASFESWPDNQYAFFSSGCNDSRTPYFLLNDNTFKVGTIISTVMGCGETGNRIESALFDFMRDSSSQLTLNLQLSQPMSSTTDNQNDMPRYNLLQTMATGETLVWQNEAKKIP